MNNLKIIAQSSIHLFAGYLVKVGSIPSLEGMTFTEVPAAFKGEAQRIVQLLSSKEKVQNASDFLKAKTLYHNMI